MSRIRSRRGFAMVVAVIILAAVITSLFLAISRVQGQRTLDHLTQRRVQAQETAQVLVDHISSTLQSMATTSLSTMVLDDDQLTDQDFLRRTFGTKVALLKRGRIVAGGQANGLRIGDHILYWSIVPVRTYDRVASGSRDPQKLVAADLANAGANFYLTNSNPDPGTPTPAPEGSGTKGRELKTNMLYELVVDCFAMPPGLPEIAPRINADDFDPYTEVGREAHVQLRRMVKVSIKRLFEYVIFYNATGPAGDIEFGNAPPLYTTGAIHSNGAIYIGGTVKNTAPTLNLQEAANTGLGIYLGGAGGAQDIIEGCNGIFRLRKVSNYHSSWYLPSAQYPFTTPLLLPLIPPDPNYNYNGTSDGRLGGFTDVPVQLNGMTFTSAEDSRAFGAAFSVIDPEAQYIKDNNTNRKASVLPIQQRIGGGFASDRPLEPFVIIGNPVVGSAPSYNWVRPANFGTGFPYLWSTTRPNTPPRAGDVPANEMLGYQRPVPGGPSTLDIEPRLFVAGESLASLGTFPSAANRSWNDCRPLAALPITYTPTLIPPPPAEVPASPLDSDFRDFFTNLSNAGPAGGFKPALNEWIGNALGIATPAEKAGITILERGMRNKTHHLKRIETVINAWVLADTPPPANLGGVAAKAASIYNLGPSITSGAIDTIFAPSNWTTPPAVSAERDRLVAHLTNILPYTMGTMVPNTDFNNSSLEHFPIANANYDEYPAGAPYDGFRMEGYCHAMRSHFVVYFGCDQTQRFNDITSQFFSFTAGITNPKQLRAYLAEEISPRETGWARQHRYIGLSQRISLSLLSLNVGEICSFVRTTPLSDVWPSPFASAPGAFMSSAFNGAIYVARTPRLFGGPFTTASPGIVTSVNDNRPWQTLENAQCNGWWNPKAPLGFNPAASFRSYGAAIPRFVNLPMPFSGGRSTGNVAAAFFGGLNRGPAAAYTTWPVIGDTAKGTVDQVVGLSGGRPVVNPLPATSINQVSAWNAFPAMPLRVRIENAALIDWGGNKPSSKALTRSRREGLTIYTPQVAYLKGDFNTLNPEAARFGDPLYPPCSLYADNLVVRSNAPHIDNVSNTGSGSIGPTPLVGYPIVTLGSAQNTTYRLSLVINNIPTDRENSAGTHALPTTAEWQQSGNGSGELENVMRYEERWNARSFTFEGSLVVFGRARYTRWNNEGLGGPAYFGAPTRIYRYNKDLLTQEGQPPFAPFVVKVDSW